MHDNMIVIDRQSGESLRGREARRARREDCARRSPSSVCIGIRICIYRLRVQRPDLVRPLNRAHPKTRWFRQKHVDKGKRHAPRIPSAFPGFLPILPPVKTSGHRACSVLLLVTAIAAVTSCEEPTPPDVPEPTRTGAAKLPEEAWITPPTPRRRSCERTADRGRQRSQQKGASPMLNQVSQAL